MSPSDVIASATPFNDARLAVIYDVDNPAGADHDFYRALAAETGARSIVDLGCGTGVLTVTLAAPGRRVLGIDPAPAMLERARSRPGGDAVEWVTGTAKQIPPGLADLVVMTGNVAMHIVGDAWPQTLTAIAAGLRPGGVLAFETRNPVARAWEGWQAAPAVRQTPAGAVRESLTTTPPDADGIVVMTYRNEMLDDGDVLAGEQRLQFRSHEQLRADLCAAGLQVEATYGDWGRTPFSGGPDQRLMVLVARRPVD